MSIGAKLGSGWLSVRNGVILPVRTFNIIIFGSCVAVAADSEELPESIMNAVVSLSPNGRGEEDEVVTGGTKTATTFPS